MSTTRQKLQDSRDYINAYESIADVACAFMDIYDAAVASIDKLTKLQKDYEQKGILTSKEFLEIWEYERMKASIGRGIMQEDIILMMQDIINRYEKAYTTISSKLNPSDLTEIRKIGVNLILEDKD